MTLADLLDQLPSMPSTPVVRLRQALAMHDEGVALQRLNLRRRHPDHTQQQLDKLLASWLLREDEAREAGS